MTTSGSTNFNSTRNDIIKDALLEINVIGENETPTPDNEKLASRVLNRMVKAWEAKGIHLWEKATAIVFLQKDQRVYKLSSTEDHATENYYQRFLDADAILGATSLTITDTTGYTVGDYIGIKMDDNSLHWSTIATIPDSTTVTINDALTIAATSGNVVWTYTTRLDQPVKVYSANRHSNNGGRDIPLNELSYQGYFELPNKDTSAIPTSYNFDKQRDYAVVNVWPNPSDVNETMFITFTRKIQDFDTATNTPDFPQEWQECLVANLAPLLAKFYGKNKGESYQDLKIDAAASLADMLDFDNESGSIYIQPDYDGMGDVWGGST